MNNLANTILKMCAQKYLFFVNHNFNKKFKDNKHIFYKNRRKKIDDYLITFSYKKLYEFFNIEKNILQKIKINYSKKNEKYKKAVNYKYLLNIFYKFNNEHFSKINKILSDIFTKNNKITFEYLVHDFLNIIHVEKEDEINDIIFNEKFIVELNKIDNKLIIDVPISVISLQGLSVYIENIE